MTCCLINSVISLTPCHYIVLISLIEFYDDLRLDGIQTENESEFRGYHIIAHFRDQDVVRQTMTLPLKLFKHPQIQLALKFHSLAQRSNEIMETASRRNKPINVPAAQNFYTEFFKLVAKPETPFLMACLLESHFADVRKGALKAMNISYVYKLSGVPASYIERILCYDSLRQLMDEAHLYGLVVDESLDEPTFRFGQKHFKTKQSVFREPLTNPPQRRSAKLVEPKKYSMLFKDIINGVEGTDIKQDLVMPAESTSMADASTKQYGILDNRAEQLKTAKAAADAAEAAARMERQKMEALMNEKKAQKEAAMKAEREKKEKMEAERAAAVQKAHQEREERAKREKARLEQLRLEEERKLIAQQRELEALKRREEEERKRRLLDKDVIGQEMYVDLMSKFIEDAAKEFVLVQMMKQKTIMNFIRRKTIPWLSRSRQNIEARNEAIAKRGETLRWSKMLHNNNPYSGFKIENLYKTRLLRTPEMITERTTWALDLDESAKEMNVYKVNNPSKKRK